MFGDKELIFYDQDPWESYHDDGICRGVYKEVAQHLNVGHFFITSQFWSTYVARVDELPTQYVRMGMLPRLCSYGKAPSRRNTLIGFQGTLHQNRKEFFDRVGQFGLNVTLMKSASHKSYLKNLRRMKIFLHSENPKLTIEGSRIDLNATWIKDLEVASQGCFAIRSWDVEADKYGIEAIPLIKSFRDESEIPNLVEEVLSMSTVQTRDEVEESVDRIKARDDWDQLAHAVANPGGSSYRF
jgi:hypothetical protein